MAKKKKVTLRGSALLRAAIEASQNVERTAAKKRLRKPLQLIAFGFLVRNRRIARAIERLSRECAYESRMLLRVMLEIQINYAWIRLRSSRSRSLRFLKFWPLERLKLLEKTATVFRPPDYSQRKRLLEVERAAFRRLFRFRNKEGKMVWAKSWAKVSSVEARLAEVLKKERPGAAPDPFLYGMYVSFSSATHASPDSVNDVLQIAKGRLKAKLQPERRPGLHRIGAFVLLAWTIEAFLEDAKLKRECRGDVKDVMAAVKERKRRSRFLNKPV